MKTKKTKACGADVPPSRKPTMSKGGYVKKAK